MQEFGGSICKVFRGRYITSDNKILTLQAVSPPASYNKTFTLGAYAPSVVGCINRGSSLDNKRFSLKSEVFREYQNVIGNIRKKLKEGEFSMELQEINQKLKETRDELLGILNGLSGDQLNKQKDAYSWSISQICQHLSKTEELYVVAIRRGLKSKEDSFIENKPLEFLLDRSKKLEAPDIAKPTDELLEYQEIIEKLNNSRQKLYEILNTIEDPSVLSRRHFIHPVFKEMLLIEWVRSLYLHEQRHIKQISEVIDGFK